MKQAQQTHILLADDDQDDVMIFRLAIKELSVDILLTHAEDGGKLLELLKELLPDIIFLDIDMPCKDGKECIREIRGNRKYDHIPVIMYTSLAYSSYVEQTYRAGANLFMVKPTSIRDLADKIQNILAIKWKEFMYYPPKEEFVIA
jgi:CheY-like chemotaxis protein